MAKLMVMIDLGDMSYEDACEQFIHNPNPDWFESRKPGTNRVYIDEDMLEEVEDFDGYYVFELIGVRP